MAHEALAGWQPQVTVVGAGMAGAEAAWQLAQAGVRVALIEMKPAELSPAHQTPFCGELVCSNSLRSDEVHSPAGLLKAELRGASSMVIACADAHRVPAGGALAVERFGFGRAITAKLALHPNIRLERRCLETLPTNGLVIVATGPLTAGALGRVIMDRLGGERMYFYDAIAPIVAADSVDRNIAFVQSRWDRSLRGERTAPGHPLDGAPGTAAGATVDDDAAADPAFATAADTKHQLTHAGTPADVLHNEPDGDYLNCPFNKEEYLAFVAEVAAGRKVAPHHFEQPKYFEGCMPIETMVERGPNTLRFGPMRPIGLTDPRTGRRPWAVVQLRPENEYRTSYNLVGFQTRLAYPEQQRIFRMIPGLANAEFLRFGSIHRNTYIDAPAMLGAHFELRTQPNVRFAGLLTGVEGYIESCAMGLLVARMIVAELQGRVWAPPPATTMMGGLYRHVTAPREGKYRYAPTNSNFGLLPPLEPDGEGRVRKENKKERMAARAQVDFARWCNTL